MQTTLCCSSSDARVHLKSSFLFPLNSDPAARLAEGGTEARALCERQRAARAAAGAGRGPAGADVHREGDCAEPFGVFMPWLDRIPVGSTGKAQRLQITSYQTALPRSSVCPQRYLGLKIKISFA